MGKMPQNLTHIGALARTLSTCARAVASRAQVLGAQVLRPGQMVYTWSRNCLHIVCKLPTHGIHMVYKWYTHGIHMV